MSRDEIEGGAPPEDEEWARLARFLAGESDVAEAAAVRRRLDESPADAALVQAMARALERLDAGAPGRAYRAAESEDDIDVEGAFRRVNARRSADVAPEEALGTFAASARPLDSSYGAARSGQRRFVRRISPRGVRSTDRDTSAASVRWRRWSTVALSSVAASLVLLVGASVLWDAQRGGAAGVGPAEGGAPIVARTAVGERDSLRLPDGSLAVLAPLSELVVPDDFGHSARVVELRGEGYFEVVHDERRPFSVRVGDALVRDLGTAFAVRAGTDGSVVVSVTEGVVTLHDATEADDAGVRLEAGDRGTRAADGRSSVQRGVASAADVAWTHGRITFEEASFAEVADRVARWYGVELRAGSPAIAARHVTADLTGEPTERVLRVLSLALGAELHRVGKVATFIDGGDGVR